MKTYKVTGVINNIDTLNGYVRVRFEESDLYAWFPLSMFACSQIKFGQKVMYIVTIDNNGNHTERIISCDFAPTDEDRIAREEIEKMLEGIENAGAIGAHLPQEDEQVRVLRSRSKEDQ